MKTGDPFGANNRAYYAIFYSLKAVLAMERKDFKKHKDVIAYFNQSYVKTEIFPRIIGKKIGQATKLRDDSDYDDDYLPEPKEVLNQIETAEELIKLVEEYLNEK